MKNISIILCKPEGNINLGLIARTMKNFNCPSLIINQARAEIFHTETVSFAVHAQDILENHQDLSLDEIREKCSIIVGFSRREGQFRRKDFDLNALPKFLSNYINNDDIQIGLMFGNEQCGLSEQELFYCDYLCSIPTNPEHPSLNLAQAVGIALYSIQALDQIQEKSIDIQELKQSAEEFISILDMLDYFDNDLKKERMTMYTTKILSRGVENSKDTMVIKKLFKRIKGILTRRIK